MNAPRHPANPIWTSRPMVIALLALLLAGILHTWWTLRHADRTMREHLLHQSRLVAQAVNPGRVLALTGTDADRMAPDYLRLKQQLTCSKVVTPECEFIYLVGRRESGAVFFFNDEIVVRETLAAMIDHLGHTSEAVHDGVSGKTVMLRNRYEAAFVDLRMPGIDGLSLLKWSREAQLPLPIVIITGHGQREVRDAALKSGAFAFLNKPFSIKAIRQLIQTIQRGDDDHARLSE